VARVDATALIDNTRSIRRLVGDGVRVLGVVKADGYGHGSIQTARCALEAGAWGLAVSLVEEGVELRSAGITAPIVVLGGPFPGSEPLVVACGLRPVVWDVEHLRRLAGAARAAGGRSAVHLKIDTGMSRLGCLPSELPALLDCFVTECADVLDLEGAMTHLACADETDDAPTLRQLELFSEVLSTFQQRGLQPKIRHVCNSAALSRFPQARYDMVRPGIAMYGSSGNATFLLDGIRPALTVASRIFGLRTLPAGAQVSYGHTTTLTRESVIAIVPVGYEDGYPSSLSGKAHVLVQGRRCPVVGRVTMDTSLIDVTELTQVSVGDEVILLGRQDTEQIAAHDLATWSGLSTYEVFCGISKRVPRS
jgi:alanine racemase